MNEHGDALLEGWPGSYRDRIAILHAVKRPLERETVEAICATCGCSRRKFYRLFHSKYDIMYWYLDSCFSESLYRIGRTLSWEDGITMCLSLVNREREFFLLDYENQTGKPRSYYWPLDAKRKRAMADALKARGVAVTPTLDVEMRLYSREVPGLIREWFTQGDAFQVGEFAGIWRRCVPDDLYRALEL